jgi:putative transposase
LPAAVDAKRALVEPNNLHLSISGQCELLGLNRSTYYLAPATESEEDLRLMRLIDEQYLKTPFFITVASKMITNQSPAAYWT